MSQVIHLTSGAFPKAMAQSAPLLIDFWAPWSGPCRRQGPILDEVAKGVDGKAIVAKVNVDEEPGLASQFGVRNIPTLMVIKEGQVMDRMVGVQSVHVLLDALAKAGA